LQKTSIYDIFFAEDAIIIKTLSAKKIIKKGHRMTMEHQREFQPILNSSERENFLPAVPTTSDVIILGENAISTQQVEQEDIPELLDDATSRELHALDSWLSFKVKNELVSQIYTSIGNEESGINIASIKETLSSELYVEKKKNADQAERLNDIIPRAAMKEKSTQGANDYSLKDINNLQMRIAIHYQLVMYIETIESAGDDGLYELTESYIQQVQLEARDEVLSILNQQKEELESRNTSNETRIVELEGVIVELETEIEFAKVQVQDRDMALLNNELVEHLMIEAQDLAR
jgi:uncharacterized coiled-coil protein SlyX